MMGCFLLGGGGEHGVVFDSGEYLSRASALSGVSDTQKFTASIWLIGNHASAYNQNIFYAYNTFGANTSYISVTGDGRIGIGLWTTVGGVLAVTSGGFVAGSVGVVKHVHLAVDLSDSAKRKLFINQAQESDAVFTTWPSAQTLDMSMTSVNACLPGSGGGGYAHVWIAPGQYEPDYTKFINANGTPKDLGSDGSTPTGVAPAIYFRGDKDAFSTNRGTGGTFTLVGTLADSTVDLMAL